MAQAYNPRLKPQEDHISRACLGYYVNLKLAWETWQDPVSEDNKAIKRGLGMISKGRTFN